MPISLFLQLASLCPPGERQHTEVGGGGGGFRTGTEHLIKRRTNMFFFDDQSRQVVQPPRSRQSFASPQPPLAVSLRFDGNATFMLGLRFRIQCGLSADPTQPCHSPRELSSFRPARNRFLEDRVATATAGCSTVPVTRIGEVVEARLGALVYVSPTLTSSTLGHL